MHEFYKNLIISLLTFSIGCIISLISPKILKKVLRKITSATQSKTDDYIADLIIDTIKPLGFTLSFIIGWKVLLIGGLVDKTLIGISKFIFLIYIVRFINRVFFKIIQRWSDKINDKSISEMIRSLSPMIGASVWSIGIIFYLQNMGVQMAAIWALLSAGGIGAGLALKEPVQEFFEYITILLDKPFQSGQFIHIDGIWAKVERVGVRSVSYTHLTLPTILLV